MDAEKLRTLTANVERLISRASEHATAAAQEEYVGSAADGMVTATIAEGELTIWMHVLAKRRMERDELAAAVMEAVADAERQVTAGPEDLIEEFQNDPSIDPEFRSALGRVMREIGPMLRRR